MTRSRSRTLLLLVGVAVIALVVATLPMGDGSIAPGRAAAHTLTATADGGDGMNRSQFAEHRMVDDAMIVNANPDTLPPGCQAVRGERSITIRAGRSYAEPGEMFGYDTDRIVVDPCTRLTVTLINEDAVRHQWMVHGLPRETYPMGMFTIELTGPGTATATLIIPSDDRSFRVHCSLPQHEQKGMRAQLVVGSGWADATGTPPDSTSISMPGFTAELTVLALFLGGLLALRQTRQPDAES